MTVFYLPFSLAINRTGFKRRNEKVMTEKLQQMTLLVPNQ